MEAMEATMEVGKAMEVEPMEVEKLLKIIFQTNGRSGKYGINLSSEISFLIKEAAKCDYYASDLIYNIQSLMEAVEAGNEHFEWFGFRDMGVDHYAFIKSRVGDPVMYGTIDKNYRSIYLVTVHKWTEYYQDGILVTLYEVWKRD